MTRRLLVLSLFANLAFSGCSYWGQTVGSEGQLHTKDRSKRESVTRRWSSKSLKLNEDLTLTVVNFIDKTHGWIGGYEGTVYSTDDGGRTWQTAKLPTGPNSYVSGISFSGSAIGWVAVRRDPPEVMDRKGYKSIVLRTDNAGRSWQEQRAWNGTQIYRVRFINNEVGWLVGRKLEDGGLFVMHTTDGGSNWVELSSNVINPTNNDFATDIHAIDRSRATLLTVEGKVYSTVDGGQRWTQDLTIRDEPEQTFMAKVGVLGNGTVWVLGSTDSKEGMWTTIVRQFAGDSSKRFRTGDVRIKDISFLSEDEIVGCGSMSNSDDALFGSRTGVVLYSSDAGRSWEKIYSDAESRTLNAIATVDGNFWIVGDHGLTLYLSASESSRPGDK
jgi:photosystem II stability/assembly factor-like uncharacterized protein